MQTESNYIAYLTSWGISEPSSLYDSNVNTLFLSFGSWDSAGDISSSDNIASIPDYNPYWLPSSYTAWTQWKLDNPGKKVLLAFGGQTYEAIWSYIKTPEQREALAQKLVKLREQPYPVYKKNLSDGQISGECLDTNWDGSCNYSNYQLAGYVNIDGFDFDFEKGARITQDENENLLALVKRIRELSSMETKLSLTTYHVGADPVECISNTVTDGCSYTESERSAHHGEVIPLLKASSKLFDIFNVMAYDAGRNFRYDVAMENYAKAVGDKSKVVLGITNNMQWGPKPEGSFVQSLEGNLARAKWQAESGFGGLFLWAFGSNTEQLSMPKQVSLFNELINESESSSDGGSGNVPPIVDNRSVSTTINLIPLNGQSLLDVGSYLSGAKLVNINTFDGAWVRNINLPSTAVEGDRVVIKVNSQYAVNVTYGIASGVETLGNGESNTYLYSDGAWKPVVFNAKNDSTIKSLSNVDTLENVINTAQDHKVIVVTSDGNWVKEISLPSKAPQGSKFTLVRRSTYAISIHYADQTVAIPNGTSITFSYLDGTWKPGLVEMKNDEALRKVSDKTFTDVLQNAKANNASIMINP
ncbi:glycosyl hydrolase family 18 protein [Aeromonas veronii]|uniref:glycosyl hydrolase family 18 protein n=1 Tax=Aeromonas veronii TaxID=654 RepID=UPI004055948D